MDQRCLIVSYYFPPTGAGGVQRIGKLVKYGTKAGWQFTVITADHSAQNIPDDPSLLTEIPASTKIIPIRSNRGYGETLLANTRLKAKSSYWKRWLSAFRYLPDAFVNWLPLAKAAILKEWSTGSYACVLLTAPPYSLAMLAADLSSNEGIPVILDMRDPWTENPYKLHPTSFHRQKDCQIEKEAISQIPFGISAYSSIIDFYNKMIPNFKSQNWTTIANGYDEQDFKKLRSIKPETEGLNIAFSGTFYSHINNPGPLFQAMHRLNKINPIIGSKINFHYFGKSNINLDKLVNKYGLNGQIKQAGYLKHHELLDHLSGMDAFVFILDERDSRSANTIGGKVYEYLRLKKPILALVPEKGEAANLIRETKSGMVVASHDTAKIATILQNWATEYPQFSFINIDNFSREKQAGQFLEVFRRVASAQE